MKIAILGSCTTRDMVKFLPKEMQLVLYVARSSFISLAAEAVEVNENQIRGEHAFNRRIVLWDLTKVFWEKLEEARPDVLLIDFIDERFDLWKKGKQVATRSNYLALSGIEEALLDDFELVRRDADATHELWKQSCELMVPRLKRLCKTIILHRSVWAEKYYVDGKVRDFAIDDLRLVTAANIRLNAYYDHFMTLCPDAKDIKVEDRFCVSNFAHKWGRDFFHYGDEYYNRLAEIVKPLIKRDVI